MYEFLDPDAGSDLDKMKEDLEGRMKWIWEFDTEKEVERVVGALNRNSSNEGVGVEERRQWQYTQYCVLWSTLEGTRQ